jgi:hypothetical protein
MPPFCGMLIAKLPSNAVSSISHPNFASILLDIF